VNGDATFPIGKYKGTALRDIPKSYIAWFLEQDWAEEKYGEYYNYWANGEHHKEKSFVPDETVVSEEVKLLDSMPMVFCTWWYSNYERVKVQSPSLYLSYLRVAVKAWQFRDSCPPAALTMKATPPVKSAPLPPTPSNLPDALTSDLNAPRPRRPEVEGTRPFKGNLDEDPPF